MSTPVATERKGYRRGLILGLTMAESMLLLVFCLLLVAAAIINEQKRATEQVVEQKTKIITKLTADNLRLDRENKELVLRGNAAKVSNDEWQKLRWAREVVARYTAAGGKADNVEMVAEDIETIAKLRASGFEISSLVSMTTDLKTLSEIKRSGLTSDEFSKLSSSLMVLKEKGLIQSVGKDTAEKVSQTIEIGLQGPSASKPHEWPPIINLSDADKYFFESGRAIMSDNLRAELQGPITDQIASILKKYDVDVVEVIGHTDEQAISGIPSNLDKSLNAVLNNRASVGVLKPGDNAGLGLARAVAVTQVLQAQEKLKDVTVLPYSAAQLIVPGDRLTVWKSGNDESRRRIEIRVRKRDMPAKS